MNNTRENNKREPSGVVRLLQASVGVEKLQRNYWDASVYSGTAMVTEPRRGGFGQLLFPTSYRVAAGIDNTIRGRGMRTDAQRMARLFDTGRNAALIAGAGVGILTGEPAGTVFACTAGFLVGTNFIMNTVVKGAQHLR